MEAKRRRRERTGGDFTAQKWRAFGDAQDWICAYCLEQMPKVRKEVHVDHWHPLANGGIHHPDNLRLLHAACNIAKHDRQPPTFFPPPFAKPLAYEGEIRTRSRRSRGLTAPA